MFIKEIKNKIQWEDFLKGCEEKTFLQSWNWGKFNEEISDNEKEFVILRQMNLEVIRKG